MADRTTRVLRGMAAVGLALAGLFSGAAAASAAPAPATVSVLAPSALVAGAVAAPASPAFPEAPTPPTSPTGSVSVKIDPNLGKPSQAINIILLLTLLSVAPALLVLCTSFTKIIVVLSLTRNALGTTTIPPNQVLAGLALFLSLFIMSPVLSAINNAGVQPYLKGQLTQSQAYDAGVKPLHDFMMRQTRPAELATMVKLSREAVPSNPSDASQTSQTSQTSLGPATPADVPMTTLVPAFVLSELKSAFIIGFVIFVPFLVIDVVVSSTLMSMGMMMLPPALISLPFKLLLFVMVSGWSMIATALVQSYH